MHCDPNPALANSIILLFSSSALPRSGPSLCSAGLKRENNSCKWRVKNGLFLSKILLNVAQWVSVIKVNGTSTPKGSYRAKTVVQHVYTQINNWTRATTLIYCIQSCYDTKRIPKDVSHGRCACHEGLCSNDTGCHEVISNSCSKDNFVCGRRQRLVI